MKIRNILTKYTEDIKRYISSKLSTVDKSAVHNSGNETINGVKTFSSQIVGTVDKAEKDKDGNVITETYATKQDVNDTFMPLAGGTLSGNIVPDTTGTRNLGTESAKFKEVWADEVHISQNTLYIGDVPVIGSSEDTIVVKADPDQSLQMKTSGKGLSQITSESGVTISSTGINSNISVSAKGSNASVSIASDKAINITSASVSIDADTTIKNLTVTGTTTTVNSEDLKIKDNVVELNSGETGNGVSKGTAGIKVNRGVALPYLIQFDESDGLFKVGKQGDLETIASRPYVDNAVSTKANDSGVVHKSGDETIAGNKIFSGTTKIAGREITFTANGTTDVWGKIPVIHEKDGLTKLGQYVDFHATKDDTLDYCVRLRVINSATPTVGKGDLRFTGGSITPNETNVTDLGSSSLKWKDVYATTLHGDVTGNSTSATKLKTARTINGTSFDGTANITTANWGTARNISITDGTNTSTAVSVNGSQTYSLNLPDTIKATFVGDVTGNVTGNCSGTAANVTGTVAIANGGTGATTRLNAFKNLTNESVGESAQYFITITSNWAKVGYTTVAQAKKVLGLDSVANVDSSKAIVGITRSGTTFTYTCVDGSTGTFDQQDNNTKYGVMTAATASAAGKAGLVPAPAAGKQTSFLRGDGTWVVPTNTTYSFSNKAPTLAWGTTSTIGTVGGTDLTVTMPANPNTDTWNALKGSTTSAAGTAGYAPAPAAGAANRYLRCDGTWQVPPDNNTKYGVMTAATASADGKAGLVPAPAAGKQTSFLRGDGTWVVPTNTTYSNMTAATASAAGKAGLVPAPAAGKQTSFLRGDGTWVVPTNTTYSFSNKAPTLAWGTTSTIGTVGGTDLTVTMPANPNTDTHWTTTMYAGAKDAKSNAATTNGNTYIKLYDNSTVRSQLNIKGSGATTVTTDANGVITISSTDNNTTYSVATTSKNGLMSSTDKTKLDGIAAGANNYVLPTASSTLGGVKTTSTVTDTSGYTACPIISGVPYYKDTNTTYTLSSLGIGNVKNYDQSKAIKSITRSGTTFTYTCLDGTTGTFTQLDNNTTYSAMSAAEATTGTATTARSITAKVLNDKIDEKIATKANANHNHNDVYVKLTGGTITNNINKVGISCQWKDGRTNAVVKTNATSSPSDNQYVPCISAKSYQGSWELGTFRNNDYYLSYITDADFDAGTNKITAQYKFCSNGTLVATKFQGALVGNSDTTTQFSSNAAVTLTGDVTGTASSKKGWSVAATVKNIPAAATFDISADDIAAIIV